MKNIWVKIVVVTLVIFFFGFLFSLFFSQNKTVSTFLNKVNKTIQNSNSKISSFFKPLNELKTVNKKIAEIDGVKTSNFFVGFNSNSSGRTDYIKVIISLKKGKHLESVSNKIADVVLKNYPNSKIKDEITIIERNELNLGFFRYSKDIETISKSPKEWEEQCRKFKK